jgi:hypothetical protein
MWRRVVWHIGINVSKVLAASIFKLRNEHCREERYVIIGNSVWGRDSERPIWGSWQENWDGYKSKYKNSGNYNRGEDRNVKEECRGKRKKRDNFIYICGLTFWGY